PISRASRRLSGAPGEVGPGTDRAHDSRAAAVICRPVVAPGDRYRPLVGCGNLESETTRHERGLSRSRDMPMITVFYNVKRSGTRIGLYSTAGERGTSSPGRPNSLSGKQPRIEFLRESW